MMPSAERATTTHEAIPADTYIVTALTLFRASLRRGERVRLPVTGWSMAPLLQPGDAVWIAQAEPEDLRRGTIVVVARDGYLLTHRLVAADAHGWYTKGDNNRLVDVPVPIEAIQGRIVTIERSGRLINIQRQPWPIVDRLLGWLSWLETGKPYARRRWLRRSLHPDHRLLTSRERLPVCLAVRILVALAVRCSIGRLC